MQEMDIKGTPHVMKTNSNDLQYITSLFSLSNLFVHCAVTDLHYIVQVFLLFCLLVTYDQNALEKS